MENSSPAFSAAWPASTMGTLSTSDEPGAVHHPRSRKLSPLQSSYCGLAPPRLTPETISAPWAETPRDLNQEASVEDQTDADLDEAFTDDDDESLSSEVGSALDCLGDRDATQSEGCGGGGAVTSHSSTVSGRPNAHSGLLSRLLQFLKHWYREFRDR